MGAWKRLCPEFTVNFGGFDLSERLSEECLKCLELARKVGLHELEDEDVDSLLETVGKELATEELDKLEKQRCQLEKEMEAEQHPTVPSTMKQLFFFFL